jgi:hypothetical protein
MAVAETPRDIGTVTDAEVVAYLTSLVSPLERWCVYDQTTLFWSEQMGAILSLRCHDWPLSVACRHYLTGRGWEYSTHVVLYRHAVTHGWRGWPSELYVPPSGGTGAVR